MSAEACSIAPGDLVTVPLAALPLPTLMADADGSVSAVNAAWGTLSGLLGDASLGDGWLDAVEPIDRTSLRDQLRAAAAEQQAGTFECRLTRPEGRRWTRWWWQPSEAGGLVICVDDIDEEKTREAGLWQRATHDPLTGLVNRAQLLDLLERALQRSARRGPPPAVVYVDLDGFKAVNDVGGHPAGDQLLRDVAERMAAAVRPADVVARVGGDEFAVLCEALPDPAEADAVADRIRRAVRRSVEVDDGPALLGATAGVAFAQAGDTAEGLLARADEAMYAAKSPDRRAAASTGGSDPHASRAAAGEDAWHARAEPGVGFDDAVLDRLFSVGMVLASAASLVQGPAADRLDRAIADLDVLARDVREASFARLVSFPAATPDGALRAAMDALVYVERLLSRQWRVAQGDRRTDPQVTDRLARAARLAGAAERALHPDAPA